MFFTSAGKQLFLMLSKIPPSKNMGKTRAFKRKVGQRKNLKEAMAEQEKRKGNLNRKARSKLKTH